ncbi:Calx-beta domain-containing protein [Kribbella flavida]|uniref:Calx-beta domain-containing protein n=1 Tax=Kribbella flavida TaxID=182640 RepID=UPI0002ED5A2C|nr:Calx-beta domain-containing protein [Kribbella flavida]
MAAEDPKVVSAPAKNWWVSKTPDGYLVTVRLDRPAPIRDAKPMLAADGRPIGPAEESADRKTLSLVTQDASVLQAKEIRLATPTDQVGKKSPAAGETDEYWLKPRQGPLLGVDPAAPGGYKVGINEYNLGDQAVFLPGLRQKSEVRGRVYSPVDASGARPVVVFLHGRHLYCYGIPWWEGQPWPCPAGGKPVPSFRGYDAPAKALASHGYQVVSVSSNGINAYDHLAPDAGSQARAELVLHHLGLWRTWSTTGGGPFGQQFVGKMDLQNVGLMGHSRGGDGMARAATLNAAKGSQYGVRAVLPLAPTDFTRATLPEVATSVILPYCDGDVADLQGQLFYDDSRYAARTDDATRSTVTLLGANHNYFNTEWTPGQSEAPSEDDWPGTGQEQCDSGHPGRLSAQEQQAAGAAYIAGFFRLHLGKEKAFLPLFDGSDTRASSAGRAVTRVVSQAPRTARLDVSKLDQPLPDGSTTGQATASVCAGNDVKPGACVSGANPLTTPHWVRGARVTRTPPIAVTKLSWTGTNGAVRVDLPAGQRDIRQYRDLTFRAAPDPAGAAKTDLTVEVVDGLGKSAEVPVSAVSDALVALPGGQAISWLPKVLLRTVRIPLTDLPGINLGDVRSIRLLTDRVASGSVFLSDLALSTPGLGQSGPSTLPQVSAQAAVSRMQEGNVGGLNDYFVTLSRPSTVPVVVYAQTTSRMPTIVREEGHKLVFQPGQTRHRVTATLLPNTRDGDDVLVGLQLSAPVDTVIGAASFGATELIDDDPTPTLTIEPLKTTEGAGTAAFQARLSAPSDRWVTVTGQLQDGTAVLGQDYQSTSSGRFVGADLGPGVQSGPLEVKVVNDQVKEPEETFSALFDQVINAELPVPTTVSATISDDD